MDFLPISLRVNNQQILIIGGGKVALHKIELLKRFANKFKVISPDILSQIKNMEGVECIEREYMYGDLEGYRLAYVTTNNHKRNHEIARHARAFGCLVNVADDASYCDFVSPAIYIDDNMTVAVGSDGKDVLSSIKLRDKIRLLLSKN